MFVPAFVALVAGASALTYAKGRSAEVEYLRAATDGNRYLVLKRGDSQAAADMLGSLNLEVQSLIRHLREKYPDDARAQRLERRYNPNALSEGSPSASYTSYSVNKGEQVVVCMRQDDEKQTLVRRDVVTYVVLHELGHLAVDEIGHPPEFWNAFRWIAAEAISLGVYAKVDFKAVPQQYCGITITSSVV